MMRFIGIDPGASGAIALLDDDGHIVHKMPTTERDILDVLRRFKRAGATFAVLEHVWSTPGQGGAFAFGKHVGHCQMALTAERIPYDQVIPRRWQAALGVAYPKDATDTEKKNITKRRAQQLFPTVTITHAIADALLIAEYCRRYNLGLVNRKGRR